MSLTKKVAYNTVIQFTGKIISTIIGVIIVGLITRHLGQAGYGQYATVLAFVQFFAVIVDLGLYLALMQEISDPEVDEKKAVSNVFTIKLITSFVFFALAPFVVLLFPYAIIVKQGVVLMSVSFFLFTLAQVLVALFQKNLRMDKIIGTEVLGRFAFLITVILAVVFQKDLLYIILGNVVFNLIYFSLIFFMARGYTKFSFGFDFAYWKKIWHRAWPIALTSLLTLVYFKADTLILSVFRSEGEVGIYGATYKVLEIIGTFPHMFLGLVLPVLTTAYVTKNIERFKRVYQKVFDFFLIVAAPLIVGTMLLADRVMVLIAGDDFLASGGVLKILIWATAIIFFGSLFGYIILAIDKQKKMIPYYIITAVLSLILYFVFIPQFSYWAAASITVFIELLYAIFAFYVCYKYSQVGISLKMSGKIIFASLIMGVFIYLCFSLNLILLIVLASLIYALVLYLVKGIDKSILNELRAK
ncbi:MAG: flippase [Candidatus Komeilibacteria bacterium]